jgi:excisionase family DNA binding protein
MTQTAIDREGTSKFITTSEAAVKLNVHGNTVRRWCNSGIISSYRINRRGDRRLVESDVDTLKNNISRKVISGNK